MCQTLEALLSLLLEAFAGVDWEGPATWGRRPMQTRETGNKEQSRMKGERRESVGEEMMFVLSVLGQILVEVADAQVSMCQSLEALLSLSLEA